LADFTPITNAVVLEETTAGHVNLRSGLMVAPMSTDELGKLAAQCGAIYFRRTGKVPIPPATPPFATETFEPDDVDQRPDPVGCEYCLDECTGECL
jgi:hypothetical protein